MFSSEMTVFLSSYCVLSMYTRLWWVEDRYAVGRLPPGKTPIGKKVASPLKNPFGKTGGVGCFPLPCLRRLFTHDDEDCGGGDGVMMTMVMMDGPHCPWVIYSNDAVQCS